MLQREEIRLVLLLHDGLAGRLRQTTHVPLKVWFATEEELVKVRSPVGAARDSAKAPCVDDAVEGVVIVRVEEHRQHEGFEDAWIVDLPRTAMGHPRDDLVELRLRQNRIKLDRESLGADGQARPHHGLRRHDAFLLVMLRRQQRAFHQRLLQLLRLLVLLFRDLHLGLGELGKIAIAVGFAVSGLFRFCDAPFRGHAGEVLGAAERLDLGLCHDGKQRRHDALVIA
mmetsp:Transcript_13784/g.39277  ORF Transcript_13784/g.39277 Transcript_13784/m.39277 type:complete len:227 (+) Transcript_13784:1487-2167(+)